MEVRTMNCVVACTITSKNPTKPRKLWIEVEGSTIKGVTFRVKMELARIRASVKNNVGQIATPERVATCPTSPYIW